jgi:hypothetical protein
MQIPQLDNLILLITFIKDELIIRFYQLKAITKLYFICDFKLMVTYSFKAEKLIFT